jgi:hypothetical protein
MSALLATAGAVLLLQVCSGLLAAGVAPRKGRAPWMWFLIAVCLPIAGVVAALVAKPLPRRREPEDQRPMIRKVLGGRPGGAHRTGGRPGGALTGPPVCFGAAAGPRRARASGVNDRPRPGLGALPRRAPARTRCRPSLAGASDQSNT